MNYYIASTYGASTYNTNNYDGTSVTGSTGTGAGGGTTGSGVLTDTGIALAVIVTLACLIALVAVAIRVWKRPAKQLASESVQTPENHVE